MVKNSIVSINTLNNETNADLLPSPIEVNTLDVKIENPQKRKLNEKILRAFDATKNTGLSLSQNKLVI